MAVASAAASILEKRITTDCLALENLCGVAHMPIVVFIVVVGCLTSTDIARKKRQANYQTCFCRQPVSLLFTNFLWTQAKLVSFTKQSRVSVGVQLHDFDKLSNFPQLVVCP